MTAGALPPNGDPDLGADGFIKWNEMIFGSGGRIAQIRHGFADWTTLGWYLDQVRYIKPTTDSEPEISGAIPMLTWQPQNEQLRSDHTPKDIANGASGTQGPYDEYVIARSVDILAQHLEDHGGKVYLRIAQEMNDATWRWCPFNSITPALPAFTTLDYKNMFRRIALMLKGGTIAEINRSLAGYGMPPLNVASSRTSITPVRPEVKLIWNTNVHGTPNIDANKEIEYYPGDEHVDYVGQDFYAGPWNVPFGGRNGRCKPNLNAFYDKFCVNRKKPYIAGEYGLINEDNPEWLRDVHDWADSKPKVKAMIFYNNGASTEHHLQAHPPQHGNPSPHPGFPNSEAEMRRWLTT